MKYFSILIIFSLFIISCNTSSSLNEDFDCNTSTYSNLEKLKDFNKNFNIKLPKNWKVNYHYNDVTSSIYAADTTLELTETTIIDASHVLNPINLDDEFISKVKSENITDGVTTEILSKKSTLLGRSAYYNLSKGKQGEFDHHILNVYIKTNNGFIQVKTRVYGDKLVNERLCKAVNLINKIEIE